MTWSYNDQLATDKDKVRALIGDTNENSQQVTDEAIAVWLSQTGDNVYLAASLAARGLSASYSRRSEVKIDGLHVKFQEIAGQYRDLAAQLKEMSRDGLASLGAPVIGGISQSAMDGVDEDTDRTPSRVKVGMHDIENNTPEIDRYKHGTT